MLAASPFSAGKGSVRVALRVTPRARRSAIEGTAPDADGGMALKVAVTAAPEGGKANAAVIALCAKAWRLPKSAFSVGLCRSRIEKDDSPKVISGQVVHHGLVGMNDEIFAVHQGEELVFDEMSFACPLQLPDGF